MKILMHRSLRRGLVVAALLTAIGAGAVWQAAPQEPASPAGPAKAVASTAAASAASAAKENGGFWHRLAQASEQADQAGLAPDAEIVWLLDPAHDAQWCSRGHGRLALAHKARAEKLGVIGFMAGHVLRAEGNPAAVALARRGLARLYEWSQQLSERGDPLSLAMRDWLQLQLRSELHADRHEDPRLQQNLLALGRDSGDDRVRWLAASALCRPHVGNQVACEQLLQHWELKRPQDWTLLSHRIGHRVDQRPPEQVDALLVRLADSADLPPDLHGIRSAFASLLPAGARPVGLNQAVDAQLMDVALDDLDGVARNALGYCMDAPRGSGASCLRLIARLSDSMEVPASASDLVALSVAQYNLPERPPRWQRTNADSVAAYEWKKQQGLALRGRRDEAPGSCEQLPERLRHLRRRLELGDLAADLELMRGATPPAASSAAPG